MLGNDNKYVKRFLNFFIGDIAGKSIEERILRLGVFLSFVFSSFSVVLNYFTQENLEIDIIGILCTILYLIVYIYSRRKVDYTFLFYLFVFMTLGSVFLAWKYFDGFDGSAFFILLILVVIYSLVSKGVHTFVVLGLSLLELITLSGLELYYPDIVLPYKDAAAKHGDITMTVFFAVLFIFFTVKAIFNRYLLRESVYLQNMLLEEKNAIISKQNKQLEELNATKDKFFAIVSHDLKNPISAIGGLIKLIDLELEDMNREELQESVSMLKNSSERLFELTDNLLTWGKLHTQNIGFHREESRLKEIVEINANILRPAANKKNIEIERLIDDELIVFADVNMLSSIIRNLLSNAIKYSYRDGKVTIRSVRDDGCVGLEVADDGIGMGSEIRDKLFRLDTSSASLGSEGERGSGLGLILCREFVEKHKGKLSVVSEIGKGAVFTCYFPNSAYKFNESKKNLS